MEFPMGKTGVEFYGQLEDADGNAVDLTDATSYYMRFFRPNGTEFLVPGTLRDPATPTDTDILYVDAGTSILDMVSWWEFTVGAAFLDGTIVESTRLKGFWVTK